MPHHKLRIALCFPGTREGLHNLDMPLGILQIGTILHKEGYIVRLFDSLFENDLRNTKRGLKGFKPDVVGISTLSCFLENSARLIKYSKRKLGAVTIMGGPHATAEPDVVKIIRGLDYAVIGEGEATILELLNFIEMKRLRERKKKIEKPVPESTDPASIKGIAFLRNGGLVITEPRAFIDDLDSLPIIKRDLIPTLNQFLAGGVLNILAVRGCPYNCSFCQPMLRKLFGSRLRYRSPENVVKEIEHIIREFDIHYFAFNDESFTANVEWLRRFERLIRKKGLNFRCTAQTRVNLFSKKAARLLKKINCDILGLGVESGSQEILNNLRKGITIKQIKRAFRICKRYGIRTHAYFMLGSPGETKKTLRATEKLIDRIDPDTIGISILVPTPGSDLYDIYKKSENMGISDYSEYSYYSYTRKGLAIKNPELSYNDLIEFKDSIFRKRRLKAMLSTGTYALKTFAADPSLKRLMSYYHRYKIFRDHIG